MSADDRCPVIVGVAQVDQRVDPADAREPLALMEEAVASAVTDSGAPLLRSVGSIRVVRGIWPYANPGTLLAGRFGLGTCDTVLSHHGGDMPQAMVNDAARDITAGDADVVVVVTGDTVWSRRRQKRAGIAMQYTPDGDGPAPRPFGTELVMTSRIEQEAGFDQLAVYPLLDVAHRAATGTDPAKHRTELAALWARFNEVAVTNEHAWLRRPLTAEAIGTPTADNRMIAFPYTKYMVANWDVDQAAALVVCSAGTARSLGVPADRQVFVHAGAAATDHAHFSTRHRLDRSPAIAEAGRILAELTGAAPDDAGVIDLYSCFPSAVRIAAMELGLTPGRDLTVTGGLTFAGQPVNGYGLRALATMVGRLRAGDGSLGLSTGNGGLLTKHALTLLGTSPPAGGFRCRAADHLPPNRTVAEGYEGPGRLEAYTVLPVEDGQRGLATVLLDDGRRALGHVDDAEEIECLLTEDPCGRPVQVCPGGSVTFP